MAAIPAANIQVVIERGNDDATGGTNAAIGTLKRASVYFDAGGTAVVGGTDTIDINLATAIQNSVRNGKTVTARTASISQAITTALLASPFTQVTHAGFASAIAANVLSITPKSDGYLTGSTNSTVAASSTTQTVKPYCVIVAYTEA